MSPSSWCCCRCWSRAGPSRRRRGGSASRCRAPTSAPHRIELDLPGTARAGAGRLSGGRQQPLSAPRHHAVMGQADVGGARRAHPDAGRGRGRCARATTSISWRRRKRRRRSTASSSNMPPPAAPDPRLVGDFFVPGDGDARRAGRNLRPADSAGGRRTSRWRITSPAISQAPAARQATSIPLGPVAAPGAHGEPTAASTVGLQLAEPETNAGRLARPRNAALRQINKEVFG